MRVPPLLAVVDLPRRSLLLQLLGVYLAFVALVIGIDLKVNAVAQQQVTSQVQTTDLALAQEIALDTGAQIHGAELALQQLSRLRTVGKGDTGAMKPDFAAFKAARQDIDLVYWLSSHGRLTVSVPTDIRTLGADFSNQDAFRRARAESGAPHAVLEDGLVDLTTFHAVVTLALPVRDGAHRLVGILAANLRLDDLNQSFQPVIVSQAHQHQHIRINIVDARGRLIGTPERERLLQPVADSLPGASVALLGRSATRDGTDSQGQRWLYSAVPVRGLGWAVVVQRSQADALGVIVNFRRWIFIAAIIFACGGLLFWLLLLFRVVRPLHLLARRHASLSADPGVPRRFAPLADRADEVGILARSLERLERDVLAQLAEVHTLLETSSAVVSSLDPGAVVRTVIRQVQRLVDIQAAAVFVPDEGGVLKVLVSEGRVEWHDRAALIPLDELSRPPALALHEGRPVQMVAGEDGPFPPVSAAAGFRAVLAVPIVSQHAGSVVLVVHRTQPRRFTEREIEVLVTFANYATLAWEHAVLYERSDERLREIARENERLLREATAEKQTLSAIMRSMNDGLILTSVDGRVLYANPGASTVTGLPIASIGEAHIDAIQDMLGSVARDPDAYRRALAEVIAGERSSWLLETDEAHHARAISLRRFAVRDESDEIIGYGLLLRDVTREREMDQFKTTLLGAVGHELRTPLASIKGYASTLLQDDVSWSAQDQRQFLLTISGEADRLAQLVSNLLDLSRLEAGLLLLRRRPFTVEELVVGALERIGILIPDLTLDLPPTLPLVEVDRSRIDVVLRNVLANAAAYGDGQVDIRAEERGDMVVVHVGNGGPAIPERDLSHIFERFYRAGGESGRHSSGTGLGLTISRAFVEAHGGSIWASSAPGRTIVSFSLPAAAARATSSTVESHAGDERQAASGAIGGA